VITFRIDAEEYRRLAEALARLPLHIEERILVRATNKAGDMARTQLRKNVRAVLGGNMTLSNTNVVTARRANPANLMYVIKNMRDEVTLSEKYFGKLKWNRHMAGVKHKAKLVDNPVYGFATPHKGGVHQSGGGVAFRRTGAARKPIETIKSPGPMTVFTKHGGKEIFMATAQSIWPKEAKRLFAVEWKKLQP